MNPLHQVRAKTIVVTRTQEDCAPWAQALEQHGARAVVHPCIRCETIDDDATRAALSHALADNEWLAVTSARGVRAITELHPAPLPAGLKIAAVGPTTANYARERFGHVDLTGDGSGASELARRLTHILTPTSRLTLAAADRAGHDLEEILVPLGVHVERIAVYRTLPLTTGAGLDFTASPVDAILLASPSAVEGLVRRSTIPDDIPIITIGPSTSKAARTAGLHVTGEAARPDLEGLLEALP